MYPPSLALGCSRLAGKTATGKKATKKISTWQSRFEAQLDKPEPDAPIDPKTGKRKQYFRLDAFIRTCLLREMKP